MAAAAFVDEELVPALPPRASSRELGVGMATSTKLCLALFGVVALVGVGAGAALQQGLLSTSAAAAAPPLRVRDHSENDDEFLSVKPVAKEAAEADAEKAVHEDEGKGMEQVQKSLAASTSQAEAKIEKRTTTVRPSGGHQEAGVRKVVQAGDRRENKTQAKAHKSTDSRSNVTAHEHRTRNRSDLHHGIVDQNETKSHNKTSHNKTTPHHKSGVVNETHAHNKTVNKTLAHNKTVNKTHAHNETNTSRTHNTTHKHRHLTCKGGSLAACQCLFACKIFGSQPSKCSGNKADLLDTLIQKALGNPQDACLGMQCITRCAKTLQCYDDKVKHDCKALENRSTAFAGHGEHGHGNKCRYECDEEDADFLSQ